MTEIAKDKRGLAIRLCDELLRDIEQERINSVNALRRLHRIAEIVDDRNKILYTECELSGYTLLSDQEVDEYIEALRSLINDEAGAGLIGKGNMEGFIDLEIERIKYASRALPEYRKIQAARIVDRSSHVNEVIELACQISEIESIYEELSAKPQGEHLLRMGGALYAVHPKEISKILYKTKTWVYEAASNIYNSLSLCDAPVSLLESMICEAEKYLDGFSPSIARDLNTAFSTWNRGSDGNTADDVLASCRKAIKALADSVSPPIDAPSGETRNQITVTDTGHLDRLGTFIRDSAADSRMKLHAGELLNALGKLLAGTEDLADTATPEEEREDARYEETRRDTGFVLIFTYLCILEISRLSSSLNR